MKIIRCDKCSRDSSDVDFGMDGLEPYFCVYLSNQKDPVLGKTVDLCTECLIEINKIISNFIGG